MGRIEGAFLRCTTIYAEEHTKLLEFLDLSKIPVIKVSQSKVRQVKSGGGLLIPTIHFNLLCPCPPLAGFHLPHKKQIYQAFGLGLVHVSWEILKKMSNKVSLPNPRRGNILENASNAFVARYTKLLISTRLVSARFCHIDAKSYKFVQKLVYTILIVSKSKNLKVFTLQGV